MYHDVIMGDDRDSLFLSVSKIYTFNNLILNIYKCDLLFNNVLHVFAYTVQ